MTRAFRARCFGFVVLAAVFALPPATVNAAGPRVVHDRSRLDARLRAVLDQTTPEPERVIIRVRPGSRPTVRENLTAHGDRILAEHDVFDA